MTNGFCCTCKQRRVLASLSFSCLLILSGPVCYPYPRPNSNPTARRVAPFAEAAAKNDLYSFRPRYYDAGLKRFVTADPIRWVWGGNVYAYCVPNPVTFVDPLGLCPKSPPIVVVFIDNRDSSAIAVMWYQLTSDTANPGYNPGHAATQVILQDRATSIIGSYPSGLTVEPNRDWDAIGVFPVTPGQAQAAANALYKPGFSKLNNTCVDHVAAVLDAAGVPHSGFAYAGMDSPGDPAAAYQWVSAGAPAPAASQPSGLPAGGPHP